MATIAQSFPSTTAFSEREVAPRTDYARQSPSVSTESYDRTERVFQSGFFRYRVVTEAATMPKWIAPTLAALIDIQRLGPGWDSYTALPVKKDLVGRALLVLSAIMSVDSPAPSVVPLSDGGLQLEWHRRQQDLEIVFPADELPQFFYRNRATQEEQDGLAKDTSRLARLISSIG